jgi:DNA-binding SARP family transcriptional activator
MTESVGLRFQVLGPLEVRLDGRVLSLGGLKQRLLLGALLVNSNSVVSVDRLVDILWGDSSPEEASADVAKYVYRLRTVLAAAQSPGLLLTRPPGYLLSLAADQVDARRFAALLSEAQPLLGSEPARARARLDEALGLWRGPALAEFADHEFARAEITRLDGLRATAAEDRADAMLALGAHEELIPQLEALVAEYPLQERPRGQLMLALYRSGRQVEALSVCRGFRRFLLEELGLEPSASLRQLEQDILQQKAPVALDIRRPAVSAATHRPAVDLRAGGEPFIGRRADLDWLEVLFAQAAAGEVPVTAVVHGVDGIGKTSLLTAFGRLVQARGAAVLFARCDPLIGAEGAVLEAVGAPARHRRGGDAGPDAALGLIDDRLAALGAASPVLLLLDDLDPARLDARRLLKHLGSTRSAGQLLVLAATEDDARGRIGDNTAPLHHRQLTGLERDDVAELLRSVSGAARSPELVESICTETGGVPSLIAQIAHRMRDAEVAARADRALERAESARHGLSSVRDEVALGVWARGQRRRSVALNPATLTDRARGPALCPFKGLAPFGAADAEYFCGRERLVAGLVARLAVDRFLGIVGYSGTGKSSLVAAGLLPALAAGGLPGSDRWPCLVIRPGAEPMHRLADALAPVLQLPAADLHERLDADPGQLESLVDGAVRSQPRLGDHLVLVVDQFEETFTACTDPAARARFISALVAGVAESDNRLVTAVVMRADYYGACAEHGELARLLGRSQVLVAAMTDTELRRAVLEPARRACLTVEEGLADAICADAAGEPGALPLISTALLETWVRRSGATLTLAGYAEAGGVRGAVARLAEGVYDGFDPAGRATARRIFLRLADADGPTTDVRRRAPRQEVASGEVEQKVLTELIDRRLVTTAEDTVEVAHEALLREWPRLRGWLEEDREGRRLHRRLTDAASAWQADGRDEAALYRGVRLQAARDWAIAHPGDTNPLEQDFLAASAMVHERTLRSARRTARRLRAGHRPRRVPGRRPRHRHHRGGATVPSPPAGAASRNQPAGHPGPHAARRPAGPCPAARRPGLPAAALQRDRRRPAGRPGTDPARP